MNYNLSYKKYIKKAQYQEFYDYHKYIDKEYWFEQFYWFISSDGYLVICGKNEQQKESDYCLGPR